MDLLSLKEQFSKQSCPPFMIWFGDEQKIAELYLNQIETFGYTKMIVPDVDAAINQCSKKMFDNSSKVFVVYDDNDFSKAEQKWELVIRKISNSKHILICRYSKINKKLKFYARNKDYFVEFAHLQTSVLEDYVANLLPGFESAQKLIKMCGNDYGRILLEVDKIKHYRNVHKDATENKAFEELLKDGAIYNEIGDITFELTDPILGGYPEVAIKKLREAKLKGEPTLRICNILFNGFRNLLAYKGMGSNKSNASARCGLNGWQLKQCQEWDGGYSIQEVERNMLLCQEVESGIKMGKIEEEVALDYLVCGCLS